MKLTITAVLVTCCAITGCAPTPGNGTGNRDQFRVIRDGIDMDQRALICADDPQSVGFETSQACFADAAERM